MNALSRQPSSDLNADLPSGPQLLLVVEDGGRRQGLAQMLRGMEPGCRIQAEGDPIDALLSAARVPPDLVVVDGSVARGAAALTRQLAHLVPQAEVLVFDTPATPRVPPDALHWMESPAACASWFEAFRARQRAPAATRELES